MNKPMKTSYSPETLEIPQLTVIQRQDIPNAFGVEVGLPQEESTESVEKGFKSAKEQKRFYALFYVLAGVTGLVVVQLIWQIAVLTAR